MHFAFKADHYNSNRCTCNLHLCMCYEPIKSLAKNWGHYDTGTWLMCLLANLNVPQTGNSRL